MERCPNCGNKLSNIDVLCPRCGTVVEVIQIKSSIATDAAASTVAADSSIKKKDFPQSFIVYNEDFPTDLDSKESLDTESVSASNDIQDTAQTPPDGIDPAAGSSILNRYKNQLDENAQEIKPDAGQTAEDGSDYDNDYSHRYLENLMNIDLPEIDDLQSFDPDEFMREYRASKKVPSAGADVPKKKRWLELEEADGAASDETSYQAKVSEEPVTGRRYRSAAVRESREEMPARQFKEQQPARQVKEQQPVRQVKEEQPGRQVKEEQPVRQIMPASQMKKKKANILASVLLWVLVTAAFFFCLIFFDKYVQKAYGTYNNLIYSITDGKIDLEPRN